MKTWLDRAVYAASILAVFAGLIAGYVIPNVLTRPDTVTIALELPERKPVIAIYEFAPGEELPPPPPEFAYLHQTQFEEYGGGWTYVADRSYTADEKACLAKNIYFEAKNQSMKGQIAVALVTMNRVRSVYYPSNVCDVVYEHLQFSWYWDGKSDTPVNEEMFAQAELIADAILSPDAAINDFTYGSDHYHADYVEPYWIEDDSRMVRVVQIETHIFYRSPAVSAL